MKLRNIIVGPAMTAFAGLTATAATAANLPTTKAPPAPPPSWRSTFTVSGILEAGITGNPDPGSGGINFGRLFDDKANTPLLNQASIILQRPIDSTSKSVDYGFKVQLLYGSDASHTHYLGECDYCIGNINQFDVEEAWSPPTSRCFSGGFDVKVGQFVTLLGSAVHQRAGQHLLFRTATSSTSASRSRIPA